MDGCNEENFFKFIKNIELAVKYTYYLQMKFVK